MSKKNKEVATSVTPEQLAKIQSFTKKQNEVMYALAQNAIGQQRLIDEYDKVVMEMNKLNHQLIANYGEGTNINPITGEITRPQKDENGQN